MKIPRILRRLRTPPPKSKMPGFDEVYYLYWYRDILQFGGTPLQHYLLCGWKEGRDPSAGFSNDGYLAANPDVKNDGQNPLSHFLDHGLAEGRKGWQKDPRSPPPAPRVAVPGEAQKLLMPPRA